MSKNLKDYKRENIKCLIVESFETGKIHKIIGNNNIQNAIEKYTENEITYVYNPTQEQKKYILGLLEIKEENNKMNIELGETDILVKVMPILTDIKIDLDSEEDIKIIKEILGDPSQVFTMVMLELNDIILDINLEWIENLKTVGKIPNELIELLNQKQELEDEING